MKKLFSKTFFGLSAIDQALVVDAAVQELDQCWLSQEDEDRAKRKRQQIEKKAIEYGVWEEVR
jgi:hypothetical protein